MATPDLASPHVEAFCREHFPGATPRMVLARPAAGAEVSECFPNVRKMITKKGGALVLGWHLWEIPGLLLESEYHGVWAKPSGVLVDITPQPQGFQESAILFVPMRKDRLSAGPPDNLRQPLSQDPDLLEMCRLKERLVQIWNLGKPEGKRGAHSLSADLWKESKDIEQAHRAVMARLQERYPKQFGGPAT